MIPPFDHADVIAGQGTAAKELFDEVGELDALFVPLGGGGLLSGTALATRALSPRCELFGVEPTGCLGFAADRRMAGRFTGKRIGMVLSGGNMDLDRYATLLAQ